MNLSLQIVCSSKVMEFVQICTLQLKGHGICTQICSLQLKGHGICACAALTLVCENLLATGPYMEVVFQDR